MTIRELVDDAVFLAEHGKYIGALNNVLSAISGSSRKTYPKGTPSRTNPNDKRGMGDKEAFCLFLKQRLYELVGGRVRDDGSFGGMMAIRIDGMDTTIEAVLYEHFRCSLTHEGKLPATVQFEEEGGFSLQDRSIKFGFRDGMVHLQKGWIGALVSVVSEAKCNGPEFGIEHFELQPKGGVDIEEFKRKIGEQFGISPGRIGILRTLVEFATPDRLEAATHDELKEILAASLKAGALNGGALTGLALSPGGESLANWTGQLTERGAQALKQLAGGYVRVRVS